MREIRMSGSMRGGRKRAFARRACLLLYGVPRESFPPVRLTFSSATALFEIPFFRRMHVSALNFCMSLFRRSGFATIIQPQWANGLTAFTRASTKEPVAAGRVARDKPPAW